MFHLLAFKRFLDVNTGIGTVYVGLFMVLYHLRTLSHRSQRVDQIMNPNHTNLSLPELIMSGKTCYSSNRTSGNQNVNDNYKLLISYEMEDLLIYLLFSLCLASHVMTGITLAYFCPSKRRTEELKSALSEFTRITSPFEGAWLWPYLRHSTFSVLALFLGSHYMQYDLMVGHFYGLGIRFLQDPGYLSVLFPDRMWCYRWNEKGEELYSFTFHLRYNRAYGIVCLVLWFSMLFSLLLNATLTAQAIAFKFSITYRFRRLKQLLPSVNEKLLEQLSQDDFYLSERLEFFEVILSRRSFKKFLDDLVKDDHFAARVQRLETATVAATETGEHNANILALVVVKP